MPREEEDRFLSALYNAVAELHRLLSRSLLRVDWNLDEEAFVRATLGILRELLSIVESKRRGEV